MDTVKLKEGVLQGLKKYRYAIIVLIIGFSLILIPDFSPEDDTQESIAVQPSISEHSVNEELATILSQIDGAGKVSVMLTVRYGSETIYQTDEDRTETDNSLSVQIDTVIITDSDRNESALITQINPPQYLGAIIICQGADNASVRLSIVDAVSKITGLGADKISVLKMK